MSSSHLKRFAAPRSWLIERKVCKHIVRPNAGSHPMRTGIALALVLRSHGLVRTTHEIKKILAQNEVFVDGKRVRDHRYLVGLMDVVTIPKVTFSERVIMDYKGVLRTIPTHHPAQKPVRVTGKRHIGKDAFQVNCSAGRNFIVKTAPYALGDTLVLQFPEQTVVEHLARGKGAHIYLTGGKHIGALGTVERVLARTIWYRVGNESFETRTSSAFVVPGWLVTEIQQHEQHHEKRSG